MAIVRRQQFDKQPAEEYPIDISYSPAIPLGSIKIVGGIAFAEKWPRKKPTEITDATSEVLLSETPVVVGPSEMKLRIYIFGGTNDYDYKITVRAFFDNGSKLEEEVWMRVRED